MFTTYDKAIVALIVPIVVQWLISLGVPATSDALTNIVTWLVTGVLTLVAVYLTPNKGTTYVAPPKA